MRRPGLQSMEAFGLSVERSCIRTAEVGLVSDYGSRHEIEGQLYAPNTFTLRYVRALPERLTSRIANQSSVPNSKIRMSRIWFERFAYTVRSQKV